MLTYKLQGDLLEVTEALMSFTHTKYTFWYYDIARWLKSRLGTKDEVPTQPMSEADKLWVRTHYLPKAPRTAEPTPDARRSEFDPKAKGRSEAVTASMSDDDYYSQHPREECALEWRRRYDKLKEADQART